MKDIKVILMNLEKFRILEQSHSDTSLVEHLEGTYNILTTWGCSEMLCLAGLCHSIYGTESYTKQSLSLEERQLVRDLIGKEAESLVYYFGAHIKEHFWSLLEKNENFEIKDRFTNKTLNVSKEVISNLVTMTLANWLEQRPRVDEKYKYLRRREFTESKRFLPKVAYKEFERAYSTYEENL